MDSNTYSTQPPAGQAVRRPDRLAALTAAVDGLAAEDLDRLADGPLADQVLELRRQLDRLEGQWLRRLATVDGRGTAGAEHGLDVGSTAAWLRRRLRMVAVDGLLEPEAGQLVLAALDPLARPADANDHRSGSQCNADALTELARRALEGRCLPKAGGVRPQLSVVVDLDSLLHPGGLGGEAGWAGPLAPETCRRLACDGAIIRVVVTRQSGDAGHPQRPRHDRDLRHLLGHDRDRHSPTLASVPSTDRWPAVTPAATRTRAARGGCGRPWPGSRASWAVRLPSRWMWGGPVG